MIKYIKFLTLGLIFSNSHSASDESFDVFFLYKHNNTMFTTLNLI